jgi:phosphatidylinositol glycan class M
MGLLNKVGFFGFSFIVRMALIVYADHVDRTSPSHKYTEIDYMVFSEAATHVYEGNSPYNRLTYRYTPLVAYMLVINNVIHPLAGKVLFCIFDIITGIYLWKILDIINPRSSKNAYFVTFWVLDPLVMILSTRGSNDNMITLMVFIAAYYILKKQYIIAGFMYGLSVHFKIYPIIYSIVFYLFIDCDFSLIVKNRKWDAFKTNFFTRNRLTFTAVSAGTFIGLTYLFYVIYGYEFLYETYLYHLVRKDNRHNFSVYWYLMY